MPKNPAKVQGDLYAALFRRAEVRSESRRLGMGVLKLDGSRESQTSSYVTENESAKLLRAAEKLSGEHHRGPLIHTFAVPYK